MLYIYYSANSELKKTQAEQYASMNKGKLVDDPQIIPAIIINPLAQLALIIGSKDSDVISIVSNTKLKRNIKVITRDESVVEKINSKVVNIHLLDDTVEFMVDIWDNPVTSLSNVRLLRTEDLRPVYYKFSTSKDSLIKKAEYVTKEIAGTEAYYIAISNYSTKEGLKFIKEDIKQQELKLKGIFKKKDKEDTKAFTDLKNNITPESKQVKVYNSIEEYILHNNYATQEQLQSALGMCRASSGKKLTIEHALCEMGVFSKEDLVVILRGYLNEQVIGMHEIEVYAIEYHHVSDKLRKSGVIEAYSKQDSERKDIFLIIPYTLKETLMPTINKTINYFKILYTLPEYVEVLNGEYANQVSG